MTFYTLCVTAICCGLKVGVSTLTRNPFRERNSRSRLTPSDKTFSFYSCLPILFILVVLGQSVAQAQVRSVPIRWCIVEGAPAETDPSAVGEPNTDSVAWPPRTHQRSDIYSTSGRDTTFFFIEYRRLERAEFPDSG